MSQTRAQRKKQQKVLAKRKANLRKHNIQMNAPMKRFRLDVLLDGTWRDGVRAWNKASQVDAHKADTEVRRNKGEEIAPGRVVDTKSGKIILNIEGSKPKGAAPDKIADGVMAAEISKEKKSASEPDTPLSASPQTA